MRSNLHLGLEVEITAHVHHGFGYTTIVVIPKAYLRKLLQQVLQLKVFRNLCINCVARIKSKTRKGR